MIGGIGSILANLAGGSAAGRISDISDKRRPFAYGLGVVLLLLSPAAIAPAALHHCLSCISALVRVMVANWAIIPDLSIALTGAIVGKGTHFEWRATQAEEHCSAELERSEQPQEQRQNLC